MNSTSDDTVAAAQIVADGLRDAVDSSKQSMAQIESGARLVAEYLARQAGSVAAEQARIQEKMKSGSRLAKHRFTV
jgi:hypothetical protein